MKPLASEVGSLIIDVKKDEEIMVAVIPYQTIIEGVETLVDLLKNKDVENMLKLRIGWLCLKKGRMINPSLIDVFLLVFLTISANW